MRGDDVRRVDQPCVRLVCDGHRLRHLAADWLVPLGTPAADAFVPAGHAQEGVLRRVPRLGHRLVGARGCRRPAAVLRLDQLRHQLHRTGPLRAQVQRELVALDLRQHRELRLLVDPVGPDDDGRQHDRHARRKPLAGRSAGGSALQCNLCTESLEQRRGQQRRRRGLTDEYRRHPFSGDVFCPVVTL